MSRLTAGTVALAGRYRIWLWDDGVRAGLARVTGGVATLGFVGGICLAAPILLAPLTAVCLLAAWSAGRPAAAEDGEEGDDYSPEEFLAHLHRLMATTDRLHLAQIAADLYADETATGQVRDLCAAAGVTITPSVRIKNRQPTVSTGLYRKHLPPLPEGAERGDVGVVPAGQDELQLQLHAGQKGFVTLPDSDGNPVRHEIRWVTDHTRQTA